MSDASDQRANETDEQGTGAREAQAANLFDLRRIIGGLFVLYGVVLTIVGLGDSDAEIEKAAGVHINLWAGLGMLVLGGLFIAWALLRPLGRQMQEEERKRQERAGEAS
jgi:xanthine/uracil/vitamin C permease (AzgA family)